MNQKEEIVNYVSDFTQTDNKGKLWSVLQNNGAFNGIGNNFFQKVREDFERCIMITEEQHKKKSKMDKNRIFIDSMIQKMIEYKQINYSQPYTAKDIRNKKMQAFENELSQKQNEFNEFAKKPNPVDIDFSDKDDVSSGNVDDLLEKAIRERKILNQVNPQTPTPTNTTTLDSLKNDNNNVVTIDMINKIMDKLDSIEKLIRNKQGDTP